MKLELIFKILGVIFIGVAAVFLWQANKDGTFVAAVLGAVCFFLSFRFQTKERLKIRETQNDSDSEKI
jgi:ABC-type transport system involved in Fe-S cluster assembly fused permease/ATPase subunit